MKKILIALAIPPALLLVAGLILGVRTAIVAAQIERQAQTAQFTTLTNLGTTQSLTILPLFENAASEDSLQTGHGVSYLVQTGETAVLLDVGFNPAQADPSPLLHNMAQLDVSTADFDTVVITHNHPDHVGGLQWIQKKTFSLGNTQLDLAGKAAYVPVPLSYPGLSPVVADEPAVLGSGVATMDTITFVNIFPLSLIQPRMTEQVLAVNLENVGVILVVGCGHPGLESILARADQVLDAPVVGIVGGLHYGQQSAADLQDEIDMLRARDMRLVALSPHDSGPTAIQAFRDAFPAAYQDIEIGQVIAVNR